MKKTLLLIDGNSIINRAYFGLAGRSTMSAPDGTPTGALYAFLNIYLKHIQDLNPTYVCACFDLKAPTFRHLEYKEYKATRKPMPQDLAAQVPILKDIMDAMGIPRIEMKGYEADDLIGSLSKTAGEFDWETYILSGDKDDLQLVDDKTVVLMPVSKGGQTSTERYDAAAVEEKYRIKPSQFIDLKALMGDPSDNIPGVRGIGEKGATDLIVQYRDLDSVYQALDEIKPAVAEKLKQSKEDAYLSRRLATIKRDLPVEDFLNEIHKVCMDQEKTYQIFQRLGFRSIIARMQLASSNPKRSDTTPETAENAAPSENRESCASVSASGQDLVPDIRKVSSAELFSLLKKAPFFHFSQDLADSENPDETPETHPNRALPAHPDRFGDLAASITEIGKRDLDRPCGKFCAFLPTAEDSALLDCGERQIYQIGRSDFEDFFRFLRDEKIYLVSVDCKALLRKCRIKAADLLLFDLFVAGYLLSQTEGKSSLERIAEASLGELPPTLFAGEQNAGQDRQQSLFEDREAEREKNVQKLLLQTAKELALLPRIAKAQTAKLENENLLFLAFQVEMPLIGILADMENVGFAIDQAVLTQLNEEMTQKASEIEKTIYEMAGMSFNINSPKQLGEVLFKKLALPTGRKTQSGYSTDADVLDMLYDKHPIIKEIIGYRQLTKLKSTFVEGLAKNIDQNDLRVHTTFNQTLTNTGRLSSSDPNLQNIPVRQEVGREIRKAFTAAKGCLLIDADYSQIELRLLAELSGDEEMRTAFLQNDDIHMNTAEEIFDLPRDMITKSMRSAAKTVNFSIVYGISDFGLARDLGVSLREAHSYISEYYKKYPGVKTYLEGLVKEAYQRGYVETLFHRRRYIHELKSANRNIRMFGERVAMNTPVQGTAADIIKIAMVLAAKALAKAGCDAKLILQVHDELVLEALEEQAEQAAAILKEAMENAIRLSIPFLAEVKIGKDWYRAK